MSKRAGKKQKGASTSGAGQEEEGDRPQPMSIDAQLMPANIHPWLNFSSRLPKYNAYCQKFQSLRRKTFELPRIVEWQPLDAAGVGNGIRQIIRQSFGSNGGQHYYEDWENLFQLTEPIFIELCLEFHSTFEMNEQVTEADDISFMTFRLGGRARRMNMIDMARCLNIYSEEELSSRYFESFLESGENIDIDFYPRDVWNEVSDEDFISGGNSYKDLRQMEFRVIHRFLAYTICQRREGCDKVSQYDLWYLRKFAAEENICIPFSVAWFLKHNASGLKESSPICGGHFITKIAKFFRINLDDLTRVPARVRTVGAVHFQGAEAIMPHNNTFIPFQAGGQPAQPPQRRQRVFRQQQQHGGDEHGPPHSGSQFASGSGSQYGEQPSWLPDLLNRFDNMQVQQQNIYDQQQRMYEQQTYEYGAQHYYNAWSIHNFNRLSEVVPNFQPTPSHYPPMWNPYGPNQPPPVYDEAAALRELQDENRRQQEREGRDY